MIAEKSTLPLNLIYRKIKVNRDDLKEVSSPESVINYILRSSTNSSNFFLSK